MPNAKSSAAGRTKRVTQKPAEICPPVADKADVRRVSGTFHRVSIDLRSGDRHVGELELGADDAVKLACRILFAVWLVTDRQLTDEERALFRDLSEPDTQPAKLSRPADPYLVPDFGRPRVSGRHRHA